MKPVDCCTAGDAVVHRLHLLSSGLKRVLYCHHLLEAYLKLFFSFFMDIYIYIYTHTHIYIYIYIGYTAQLMGFSFLDQGSNPCP